MNKKFISFFLVFIALILIILVFVLANKNKSVEQTNSSKLQITASFYPLYFFASQIAGDRAQVYNITPAGAEPHDYEPTPQDIVRIENSQILILNGAVEAWGDKIRDSLQGKKTLVVVAGQGILNRQLTEEGKTSTDPHVWLDPKLAKIEIARILDGLNKIDPTNKNIYSQNASTLNSKLDDLDKSFKQGLASCQKKDIVTSHAAFAYMGKEYGLNQVAIAGISPDEEPSAQKMAEISDFVKKNDIKYIFFESLVSPKLSETIAQETGAKTLVLDPLEGIPEKDMQKGVDYFSIMKNNLKNLQIALECKT